MFKVEDLLRAPSVKDPVQPQTVDMFLNHPTPTIVVPDAMNPPVHPDMSAVYGVPQPMPAAVKVSVWDNMKGSMPNPIQSVLRSMRGRTQV